MPTKRAPQTKTLALTEDGMRMQLLQLTKGRKQQATAKRLGFSAAFINDVLNERRGVTEKLASAMGYERIVLFRALNQQSSGRK